MPAAAARKAGGGGRGPYLVLGLVSALAAGAIGFVHYDQQKQRQDMRRLINEEKERERQQLLVDLEAKEEGKR